LPPHSLYERSCLCLLASNWQGNKRAKRKEFGGGVKISSRVRFGKISKAPKSTDPKISEEWRKERSSDKKGDFEKTVDLWRNQKLC